MSRARLPSDGHLSKRLNDGDRRWSSVPPGGGTPARSKSNEIILAYHCTAGGFTGGRAGGLGPRTRV